MSCKLLHPSSIRAMRYSSPIQVQLYGTQKY